MEQIRIVEGNDFRLLVTLTQVQADGTRAPLSAQVLTDVHVNVIRSMSHRPLPMAHEVTDDGALLVDFEADKLPLGNYDIEIVAKYGDMDVRSCEARILAIVYDNGMANISPTVEGSKAYDVDMTFSIITANAEGGGTVIDPELANKVEEHETEITTLQNQVLALSLGASAGISLSASTIYANTATNVKVTATAVNIIADKLSIKSGGSVLASADNVAKLEHTDSVTLASKASKQYDAVVVYKGMELVKSISLFARYPVYAGMGASASAVAGVASNKMSPRTSARGTYSATAPADGSRFYLLVPQDVTAPSVGGFVSGGAPAAFTQSTETINGLTYTVFASEGVYNKGVSITLTAN